MQPLSTLSVKLTGEILRKIVPTLTLQRTDKLAGIFARVCPIYGITTPDIFHEFIANIAHESGGFLRYEENMNYSAKRLREVFPKYFTVAQAAKYAHNRAAIANRVYASRMGNGNEASGDGYLFRGGGAIQLTGRDIWTRYWKYKKTTLSLTEMLTLVRTDDVWAIDSACWVFAIEKKLIPFAQKDDFITVVKRINGGTIGLRDRQDYYNRAIKYLPK